MTFDDLLKAAATLPLNERLRLVDSIAGSASFETDGLRLSVHSLREYKRFRKKKLGDDQLLAWLHGFPAGAVFYDIGANTGLASLLASRIHGPAITVVAIEPSFSSFESLARNVLANGFGDSILTVQLVVLDRTGTTSFNYSDLGAGAALHAAGEAIDYRGQPFAPVARQQMLTSTVDDLVARFGLAAPTHLKIDVDGLEQKVLAGASQVLASGVVRQVCVEFFDRDRSGGCQDGLAQTLEAYGFTLTGRSDRPRGEEGLVGGDLWFSR